MKQLSQNLRSGETKAVDVPIPQPRSNTALVHIAVSLVSAGTERMLVEFAEKSLVGKARSRPDLVRQVMDKARREGWLSTLESAFNRLDQPMPLGYSSAGTITALGEGLQGFHIGQRVACAGANYAVHAEYTIVPKNLLTPLPDEVDFESAAFTTLGAIAMHGFRLGNLQLGERVAIIGLGLLGLLTVELALAAGCSVLGIDLAAERVALAAKLGATAVLRDQAVEAAQSFSHGRGCDVVLICADTPTNDPVELAGQIARDRAKVVAVGAVGLNIPRKIYFEKELTFVNSRSYGPGRYDPGYEEAGHDYPIGFVRWTEGRNLEHFVELLGAKKIDVLPLITHRFRIEDAAEAYELITGKTREPFLGVLLTYPELTEDKLTDDEKNVIYTGSVSSSGAPVRIGMLGAGNFASAVLLPALKKVPGAALIGIASASGLSANFCAKKFDFHYTASSSQQLFEDDTINTIAVLTRHNLHAGQVISALKAGKNVFCEKPLALSEDELEAIAKTLSEIEGQPQPFLSVGFNRRFAPLAVQLASFLRDRSEPLYVHYRINASYIPLTHWVHDPVQGGGRIVGEGCHFVDFLTFLVGTPPKAVSAQPLPDMGIYNEDNVVMKYTFADGSLGVVSYLANGSKVFPKERVEVFCGGRVAVLDDYRSLELVKDGKRRMIRSRLRQDKGHIGEWQAFVQAIQTGSQPPIPYTHLFGVTQAMLSTISALRSKETIQIPQWE
jgi:predicted dehydrogenase/threonine dehydrogenase-like Zn-dependent dehydrogenase